MSRLGTALGVVLATATLAWSSGVARAQKVHLSVESREIYAGLPFILAVTAEEFAEEPEPTVSKLEIPGCRVTYLGVAPNISSFSIQINGRVQESRTVSFVYRYRVEAPVPGRYQVPPITVEQGTAKASTQAQSFAATDIDSSSEMKVALEVPEREIWLGETFEVYVDWYLRSQPGDSSFSVPLFTHEAFEIEAPDAAGRRTVEFPTRTGEIALTYGNEPVNVGGTEFTRFRFPALVRPTSAGVFELDPPQVVARLQTGVGRDALGFRARRYGLFKAVGEPTRLVVKQLPASGKPASFAGAVGSGFSLEARASRTVVSVGEPIELTITVRSRSNLEGIRLPPLDSSGLSAEHFDLAGESPPGEMIEDGQGRVFVVPVRLSSADVREIPAIELGYFDPVAGEYRVARSEPIALSVAGSAVVGAADVIGGGGQVGADTAAPVQSGTVGVELTLSESTRTLRTVRSVGSLKPLLLALYIVPLLLLGVRLVQLSTRASRGRASQLSSAVREVERTSAAAAEEPAREAAPRLVAALRSLARVCGREPRHRLIGELETAAFDPRASDKPLSAELRQRSIDTAREWARESAEQQSAAGRRPPAAVVGLLALGLIGGAAAPASAAEQSTTGTSLAARIDQARALYRDALASDERGERASAFARAEEAYGRLVDEVGWDRPELLADWGNAALGAGDVGPAMLAYRRALRLDRSLQRARRNVDWLRSQAPAWAARPTDEGAVETLFFWHTRWSRATRHLVAATCFGAIVVLLVPWSVRRRRLIRGLALIPLMAFAAMVVSLVIEKDSGGDAVVVADGHLLRSADSDGAPAVIAMPVPAGSEVVVREVRGSWKRVTIGGSTSGWLPAPAVVEVEPEPGRR